MEPQQQPQNPLKNPDNWTKPKVWVVPIEISFLVDDPSKYDDEMKAAVDRILNEVRGVCQNYAKNGGLSIKFLTPIKSAKQIETIRSGTNIESIREDALEEVIERILKKKEQK